MVHVRISYLGYTIYYSKINRKDETMPKLDTPAEIKLKKKLSQERARRLRKDAQREDERGKKLDLKLKAALKRAKSK